MKHVATVLGTLAIFTLAGNGALAQIGNPGMFCWIGGSNQTDPQATANGAIWLDTGSGPQLIPDSDCVNTNSDINAELIGGTSPTNMQLLDGAYQPTWTSLLLLSNPNPNYDAIPNSATWDMNFGGPNGMFADQGEIEYIVPGGTGTAYFEMFAWTGPYNSYSDAAAHGAYVADTGVFLGAVCPGGLMPPPNIGPSMPAVVLHPALPGDANGDDKVDINDLTIVLAHYGQSVGMGWYTGDFTGDGTVDINDLTIVLANYGQSVGSSAGGVAAVAEPGALVLLTVALAGLLACAWKKHK